MQNSRKCTGVVSNRSEKLTEALGDYLFAEKPFATKIVLVPSTRVKNDLLHAFARSRKWKVGAGIQFYSLQQFLAYLLTKNQKEKKLLSHLELSLLLEYEIHKVVRRCEQPLPAGGGLSFPDEMRCFASLVSYLDAAPKKREERIGSLAKHLSTLFLQYGIFGSGFLDEWLKNEGWQQKLWQAIYKTAWTYPLEVCAEELSFSHSVHLFGFSYLPPLFRDFFKKSGSFFYLLSPTPLFLGDVCSDRESLFLEKLGEKKDVALKERKELGSFLGSTNRLLANFGKRKRAMLGLLEEDGHLFDERYEEENEPKSLLDYLRAEMYHLSNPSTKKAIASSDHSLQLHAAPSKLREIEILHGNVLSFANQGVSLKEMSVLVPQLDEYRPYIEAIFGEGEVQIPFLLSSVRSVEPGSFAQGFLHLLSLKECRFEQEEVLKLFSCSSFVGKCGLDDFEASRFCKWMRKTNLRFGFNGAHRKKILEKQEGVSETGTWEWAFDCLLWGLAFDSTISLTEAEALGKGIAVIKTIKALFDELEKMGQQRFSDWIAWLKKIAERFFVIPPEGEAFFESLEMLKQKLTNLDGALFPFSTLAHLAGDLLKGEKTRGSANLQAISFASLSEGAIFDASVIFLLGMHDGAAFCMESKNPFLDSDFVKKAKEPPNRVDADRNLFLDVLLMAKEAVVMSYVKASEEDGKEVPPSLLVQEFLSYLDQGYECAEGETLSSRIAFDHPPVVFVEKKEKMPIFFPTKERVREDERIVTLRQLMKLSRHPVQFFLNKSLGIYFEREERGDEEFVLSSIEKGRFRRASLSMPLDALIKQGEAKGILPLWHFREVAKDILVEEIELYHGILQRLHVALASIFSIELVEGLNEPIMRKRELLHPPLEIDLGDGRKVKIVGKLIDISPQGMLFHGKNSLQDLSKVWPSFLVYLCLDHEMIQEKKLLLTKAGKEKTFQLKDPKGALRNYLNYFERSEEDISPFLPAWADPLLKGELNDFEKKVVATQKELRREGKDPYLEWLFAAAGSLDTEALFTKWAPTLREVMHGIV